MYKFDVVILEDEAGGYVAFVPILPGCHTRGETLEELMENFREAVKQRIVSVRRVKAFA